MQMIKPTYDQFIIKPPERNKTHGRISDIVPIDSRERDLTYYPRPDNYRINFNQTYKDVAKNMFDTKGYLSSNESTFKKFGIKGIEIISSWAENYNSWVHNKYNIPVCLIKYENLCIDPFKEFKKIFEFLKKITKEEKTQIDNERLKNTIEETSFENLKNLEKKEGFLEKQNRKVNFFNQGRGNNWKEILPKEISSEIEKKFSKEMLELGYL